MFSIAKWLDTEYFPETKRAFLKERKNGEIVVCYRGRCWSRLTSWCIFGRGDRYDLHKIFKIDESSINIKFVQNAKKFIRSPDSEQYLDDALKVFNRFRGFNFDYFANPTEFSDILQLGNYFLNEPLPVKPEDERLEDYYNAVFTHALHRETMRFKYFLIDWEMRRFNKNFNIKPKDLIAYTSRVCGYSSDWNEASKNLRPTVDYGQNGSIIFQQSVANESIYRIAKALCYLEKGKPSDHFSRIYIDSIFNLKRDVTKTFESTNIIHNFTLLQGEESSPLDEISERISACSNALFMEPLPENLLTLFSDTDSFLEKVDFFGSFFVETHSFLGCIDQNMDVLSRLRIENDKLGKLTLNVHCLSPRTNQDYEIILINFIRENYTQFTLLEKFDIFKLFTYYHSTFKNPSTLQLFLTFLRNYSTTTIKLDEIQSSIHWIAECLKNAIMSKNLLTNLNFENASFKVFLGHFSFSKNPLLLPLFAASTLPSDLDWNQINKILTSNIPSGTKFGSFKSVENFVESSDSFVEDSGSLTEDSDSGSDDSENLENCFLQLVLKVSSDDLFLKDFIANTAKDITNKQELVTLLFYIRVMQAFYTEKLIAKTAYAHNLPTLVKNIKSFHGAEPHRIPQALQQIQALLDPFESQMISKYKLKSRTSISDLLMRLAKIPNTYQPLTTKLIEEVRSGYFSKEHSLYINTIKNSFFEKRLVTEICNIKIWNESKVLTLLEAMHFGAIFGPRLNEDVIFLILEIFIALQAHEALDNDQIAAKKNAESSELSTSESSTESYSDTSSESSTL